LDGGYFFITPASTGLSADTLGLWPQARFALCRGVHVDGSGIVHVVHLVFFGNNAMQYYYSKRDRNGWSSAPAPIPSKFYNFAITGIQDSVFFSYQDYIEHKVWLSVHAPDGAWRTRLLDAAGDVGSEVSVTPFSFDKPLAVAYYDRTNGDLKVAHAGGFGLFDRHAEWNVLRVDSAGDVGQFSSALFTQDTLQLATLCRIAE
jgi:hypothetical protein